MKFEKNNIYIYIYNHKKREERKKRVTAFLTSFTQSQLKNGSLRSNNGESKGIGGVTQEFLAVMTFGVIGGIVYYVYKNRLNSPSKRVTSRKANYPTTQPQVSRIPVRKGSHRSKEPNKF